MCQVLLESLCFPFSGSTGCLCICSCEFWSRSPSRKQTFIEMLSM